MVAEVQRILYLCCLLAIRTQEKKKRDRGGGGTIRLFRSASIFYIAVITPPKLSCMDCNKSNEGSLSIVFFFPGGTTRSIRVNITANVCRERESVTSNQHSSIPDTHLFVSYTQPTDREWNRWRDDRIKSDPSYSLLGGGGERRKKHKRIY